MVHRTGEKESLGHVYTLRFKDTCLPGKMEKHMTKRPASIIWLMLVVALCFFLSMLKHMSN